MPAYIYGLNGTGKEDISEGHFPRYRRWRLEHEGLVIGATFLLALSPHHEQAQWENGQISLPNGGGVLLGSGSHQALGVESDCECLLWNPDSARVSALGAKTFKHGAKAISFANPVDIDYNPAKGMATVFAQGRHLPTVKQGFEVSAWEPAADDAWRTHSPYRSRLTTI